MGLADKIKKYEDEIQKKYEDIDVELFKTLLKDSQDLSQSFQKRVRTFIEDFEKISEEKGFDKKLVSFDGLLCLKGVVEINFSMCFDDFDKRTFSFLPLFFISFEKENESLELKKIIPNIVNFSNKLDKYLADNDLVYGEYLVLGEKREVPQNLEVSRFLSVEEFKTLVLELKALYNENIDLFISDLEDFVVKSVYKKELFVAPNNKIENPAIKQIRKSIIALENSLSLLKEDDVLREEINDEIDILEALKNELEFRNEK